MTGRMTIAKVDGRTYEIPDMWLAGFTQSNGCDVFTAVEWWHEQVLMEEQIALAAMEELT